MRPQIPALRKNNFLAVMHQSAQIAVAVPLRFTQKGRNLAFAALAGAQTFEELRHYPLNDVVDSTNHTRFYYHAHNPERWEQPEHGHFHLFSERSDDAGYSHIAALSLDPRGQPLRWFTTNRWITGERWKPAAELVPLMKSFEVQRRGRLAPLAQWLTAMVRLFADDLQNLMLERDKRLATLLKVQQAEVVFENREIDVLSQCSAELAPKLTRMGLT